MNQQHVIDVPCGTCHTAKFLKKIAGAELQDQIRSNSVKQKIYLEN